MRVSWSGKGQAAENRSERGTAVLPQHACSEDARPRPCSVTGRVRRSPALVTAALLQQEEGSPRVACAQGCPSGPERLVGFCVICVSVAAVVFAVDSSPRKLGSWELSGVDGGGWGLPLDPAGLMPVGGSLVAHCPVGLSLARIRLLISEGTTPG